MWQCAQAQIFLPGCIDANLDILAVFAHVRTLQFCRALLEVHAGEMAAHTTLWLATLSAGQRPPGSAAGTNSLLPNTQR